MIQVLSTNITSPLGLDTEQNFSAVRGGHSALKSRSAWCGVPESFCASMFTDEQIAAIQQEGCTRFESLAVHSILDALGKTDVDIHSPRTLLILSTTKANVDALVDNRGEYLAPGATAQKIAHRLGMTTAPVVVCNACISGVTALVMAHRLIADGQYDTALVCGVDCVTTFTLAGFLSFKALSPYECRPFDIERLGLNLGEAAATIIYGSKKTSEPGWGIARYCLNNDAYHISAPSPTGDGVFRAIQHVMEETDPAELATVCVHGTATMFNDQMESMAIERAGLSDVPAFALKGYYGHTMGAAGLLETILTMRALDEGIIPATRGYEEIGVSGHVSISNAEQHTNKSTFLKIISGFGGCNGVILMSKNVDEAISPAAYDATETHVLQLSTQSLCIDGQPLPTTSTGKSLLTEIYKTYIGNYPKYYKMDLLSKVVFVAAELLIQQEEQSSADTGRAILLFNASSSVVADRHHIATYSQSEGFFPSPAVFVYTLPNIVTGEVAIKHQYQGETTLVILDNKNEKLMHEVVQASLSSGAISTLLTGWIDCPDEDHFEAEIKILKNNKL